MRKSNLSEEVTNLFWQCVEQDEQFCTDLQMINDRDFEKLNLWQQDPHPFHFINEKLMLNYCNENFIITYLHKVNLDPRNCRSLLANGSSQQVNAMMKTQEIDYDDISIILTRHDAKDFIDQIFKDHLLNKENEALFLNLANMKQTQAYIKNRSELHNIDVLLADPQKHPLIAEHFSFEHCYGLEEEDEVKLVPYPKLIDAYLDHFIVSYKVTKMIYQIGQKTANSIYSCETFLKLYKMTYMESQDWIDASELPELFIFLFEGRYDFSEDMAELALAIEKKPDNLSNLVLKQLRYVKSAPERKLVKSLLRTLDELCFDLLKPEWLEISDINNYLDEKNPKAILFFVKNFKAWPSYTIDKILEMENFEITWELIERGEIADSHEHYIFEYPSQPQSEQLISFYGKKYGFKNSASKPLYCKFLWREFWKKYGFYK